MLDIMRRKKRLKLFLWLVIIGLSFGMAVFFVPGQNLGSGLETSVASVDGDSISRQDYEKIWRRMMEQYSAGGRNPLDPKMLKSLGLDRQALDVLINGRVIDYAARRLGLDVSPDEIRRAVESNPNLQNRGVFVGVEQYKAILAANNISVSDFEEDIRTILLQRKIRNVVADSMEAGEKELRDEFTRTRQDAVVSFVVLSRDDFKKKATATENDLMAYFTSNKEKYNVHEQRRVQYLLLSLEKVVPTIEVTEAEVKARWEKEPKEETVDASHILVEVKDPAQEDAARKKAEGLLKRVRAGEDFAELARKNSDDTGSATQGGNLGSFPRGKMVKEFSDVAFALKPGQVSDLVRTQFGFHIIKVLRHDSPTFEGMHDSLKRGVQFDKASEVLKQKSLEAERLTASQKDLNVVGKAVGIPYDVIEAPFIGRDTDPLGVRMSQELRDEIFRLKEIGAVGKVQYHPQGYAIPKLVETQLPKPADFKESRARIEKDYLEARAAELLLQESKKLSEDGIKLGDLSKAAAALKLSVKESGSFKRADSPGPDIGTSAAFNAAAFDLEVGKVSQPITLDGNRTAILQVKSRTAFDEAAFQKQKAEIRNQLLAQWQDAYFQEYIRRLTDSLEKSGKIRINQRAMDSVTNLS